MAVQTEARRYKFSSYFVVPVIMLSWKKKMNSMFVTSGLTSKLYCFFVVLSQILDVTLTCFSWFNLF